jgi:hypothetical protein
MRLGMNVEFEGKMYDVLELPGEAFIHLIPGLTRRQFEQIDTYFHEYWREPTVRRHHVLEFASYLSGTTIDYVMLQHEHLRFDEQDLLAYVESHVKRGHRPN